MLKELKNKEAKLVSVIIPTYKRKCVIRAIKSVLNQTYSNYEIIVVDDNDELSEDRATLIESMRPYKNHSNIKYIQHTENKKGAAARNTGIHYARGEYIAFLDDDDCYLPKRLECLVEKLEQFPEFDAVYSSCLSMNQGKIVAFEQATRSGNFKKDVLLETFRFFTGSNLFFTRKAVMHLQGFDDSFLRHQDLEFMVRFFEHYQILAVNEVLVLKNNDDVLNVPLSDAYLKNKKRYFLTFDSIIQGMSEKEKEKFYTVHYYSVLKNCIRKKNKAIYRQAKQELLRLATLSRKQKFYLWLEKVNMQVKFMTIKQSYKDWRFKKVINQELLDVIKTYEMFD